MNFKPLERTASSASDRDRSDGMHWTSGVKESVDWVSQGGCETWPTPNMDKGAVGPARGGTGRREAGAANGLSSAGQLLVRELESRVDSAMPDQVSGSAEEGEIDAGIGPCL